MTETELDRAHARMQAAPEDDALRLAFYERVADGTLLLLLADEPEGDEVTPQLFEVEGARYVLAFDTEERIAAFAEAAVSHAALPGRALAAMLAGQGVGIALNPDVAPSAMLLPPDAVAWLARTLARAPEAAEGRPVELTAPRGLPEALLSGLDRKLARAGGLAKAAWLSGVTYADGSRSHLLAFVGALPDAEPALAAAVSEALTFSGTEAGALDVIFVPPGVPLAERIARVGLRFDLPEPEAPPAPRPPGSDPDAPPRLR